MINILCALMCEAKPLIKALKLKHIENSVFRLYSGDEVNIIVSGIGKANAAAAVGFLQGRQSGNEPAAWLNLGVCGAQQAAIGSLFLIDKIIEASSQKTWYPPQVLKIEIPARPMIAFEQASSDYDHDYLMDMESAGFYEVASRLFTSECVQLLKVVSDNKAAPSDNVSEKQVAQLIEQNLQAINTVLEELQNVSQSIVMNSDVKLAYQDSLARWHLTSYQRKQLLRLLERYYALNPAAEKMPAAYFDVRDAKAAIVWLKEHLESLSLTL